MGVLRFISATCVPALLLLSVTKVDAFIGYGIEMYNPSCAFACRTVVATYMLDCSDPMAAEGGAHSTYFGFLSHTFVILFRNKRFWRYVYGDFSRCQPLHLSPFARQHTNSYNSQAMEQVDRLHLNVAQQIHSFCKHWHGALTKNVQPSTSKHQNSSGIGNKKLLEV